VTFPRDLKRPGTFNVFNRRCNSANVPLASALLSAYQRSTSAPHPSHPHAFESPPEFTRVRTPSTSDALPEPKICTTHPISLPDKQAA